MSNSYGSVAKTLIRWTWRISTGTMSRALRRIGTRLGQPKPTVGRPWPKAKKNRTLRAIRKLLENLPDDEVVVYEDEVDIHSNPTIGSDWMLRGQQKEVVTPGQNQKRYLAGALDFRIGQLIYVAGNRKNSLLLICLLWEHRRVDGSSRTSCHRTAPTTTRSNASGAISMPPSPATATAQPCL